MNNRNSMTLKSAYKICLVGALLFWSFLVSGQFSFDSTKVNHIRWTPQPESVNGLKSFKLDLGGDWSFSAQPETDFYKAKSVADWKSIEVPGEWVMQGFEVNPGTTAGYFRTFNLNPEWKSQRIKLKCEAVYSECKIWVNGKEAGSHLGGFTPFELDVTELVKNGNNTIALSVKSESLADTLSSASQYAVHPLGGITRPIYLLALPEINAASFHVSTTFDADYKNAELSASLKLANESKQEKEVQLKLRLYDNTRNEIPLSGETQLDITLAANSIDSHSIRLQVKNPEKWDPEHPNLYFLECALFHNGKELTKVVRRFGFRQIEVRGNQVFVNNQPIKLRGVCRHEVHPLRGRSLNGNQWYEDVKLFRDGNVNYIRTSHYPPNEKLLEACDELGMFVEVEGPFCWASKKPVTNANYFEGIVQPLLEMVEMNKSHPSVLHWSIANESYDFDELFKEAADWVKKADPSRPRIFSQYGPDGDNGYLEIANHHYPGPGGPDKYRNYQRPITFDEYCHLNAYNRYELMTDPGIRDFWGDILYHMWEKMYASKGVLGGALWAGIDDSFFLPSGKVVGYGTWGPVDGWRRPKPEYWHMKKIYSPVKIILNDGPKNEKVKLTLENRYFFSNLKECRIIWKNNDKQGILTVDAKPGAIVEATLPFTNDEVGKLIISVFKDSEVAVDEYAYDFSMPVTEMLTKNEDHFSWSLKGDQQVATSKNIKVEFGPKGLFVFDSKGNKVLNGWPALMLVSANNKGDTQMTKETPDYTLFSPEASNRSLRSVEVKKGEEQFVISLSEGYDEAAGSLQLHFFADGNIRVDYDYSMLKNENFRQWGLAFSLPEDYTQLEWQRKGLWSVYPDDHIGRLEGTANLFYNDQRCGLAGPSKQPDWTYNQDQTNYGSNDFRSTKRNVFRAALLAPGKTRVELKSDGSQHIRSWLDQGSIHWLIAGYDNPGSERFLRGFSSHAQLYDIPLIRGQKISGEIKLKITNE